ncbi:MULTISPECIES: hypothetical protein [unclassified Rathayibacter]|uniref:hypothetical protein n=1 Tax=unclassified Rathayibacter TaxID=2609250 RepID=UPI000CE82236|nr:MULTISPECIES: hypothetical protein [unclassified Rathayibacter]PPG06305.1 hypothetical protein C5C26_11905 [Rathayibacter sp. AY2B1]PPG73661.1 hypothetical protein C5C59_00990 [Rathayibacter sp. AY1F4]
MKIVHSLRAAFDDQLELQETVEAKVKSIIEPELPATWHYEGRVKRPESFALKVETGKFDPHELPDFFACTIVVPTMADLGSAEDKVERLLERVSRKPLTEREALSDAFSFPFDHTRLYCRVRIAPGLESGPINTVEFEVQIKTYLQHAWSIATHDLTYKSSTVSWGTQRVAAQVRATLEAAEVAIVEAVKLTETGNRTLAREDPLTTELSEIVKVLGREFSEQQLPEDMRRLAQTLHTLLGSCKVQVSALASLLRRGREVRGGHPLDLSPYATVLQYLIDTKASAVKAALKRSKAPKILIPAEIVLPDGFDVAGMPNARLV